MSALAALTFIATAVQGTPAPLFDAFKAACFDIHKFDGVAKAATDAGWTEIAETDADPRIAKIVKLGRDAVTKEEPEAKYTGQMFRRTVDGRALHLVTSRVQMKEGWWANGCRAYDLDMPAAPDAQTVTAWVGKPPTGAQASGTAVKRLWEPWQDGVTLEITYVPGGHPLGTSYGIQGLVLVSQAIGGF
jgi:hypothetical protein